MSEFTIPMLPCSSVKEVIKFYQSLGFEITRKPTGPNPYVCARFGGIEIHFFAMKQAASKGSYGTCYVSTSDVDGLYKSFADSLKRNFGKIPSSGIPRLTPIKDLSLEERGFDIVDPTGNWIRIGQKTDKKPVAVSSSPKVTKSIFKNSGKAGLDKVFFPYL
ncbi:bleomycin resistance protein [Leptospira ilyithenensis]|uniref:VOC family protein n=1 Tax=Leptospira ilyithenensis TaxID=2484901 RepID=A0A4R9LJM6_9LEPT|nr:VOC family protein [Leptospira ilyithenensis]TGN07086.1 VOC family protein [Leptospira ilyithenensis]